MNLSRKNHTSSNTGVMVEGALPPLHQLSVATGCAMVMIELIMVY